jgi:A/G-specific adenine glycosylase
MALVPSIRTALLNWYDDHARNLPWRAPPGEGPRTDPYRVWLSEVMLQQTTVPHAAPYFERFTERWPTVSDLAAAPDADLMAAWAGLGYYARARNLLACARAVAKDHGGVFPDTEAVLLSLPGVGAYTAAAVAAIAFDRPANVVDGNVERVMSRLFAVKTPMPAARPELRRLSDQFTSDYRPGDWPQALMDLGTSVCKPKAPLCAQCPISFGCEAFKEGEPALYPIKLKKEAKAHRTGHAYVLRDGQGRVALVQRPDKGLLGGMMGLPTSDWGEAAAFAPPIEADWQAVGSVEHVFTHFSLSLEVHLAEGRGEAFVWMAEPKARAALPTVFKKALDRGLGSVGSLL